MPVKKLANGQWESHRLGTTGYGEAIAIFDTRQEARNFASGKYRATKAPEEVPECAEDCPQCALEEPEQIHIGSNLSAETLPWESIPGMLPTQDIKAKNSQTGRVVKMTFKPVENRFRLYGRLFVDGRKQKGFNTGILAFKQAAERIGADLLEGVVRK